MHPVMQMIRSIVETTNWEDADEYFLRWRQERSQWTIDEQGDCDEDDVDDIIQGYELPERTLEDKLKAKGYKTEQIEEIKTITRDHYKTHQEELTENGDKP